MAATSEDRGVYALLRSRFEPALDRPFLTVPARGHWSYRQVDDLAGRMASVLVEHGLRPGDRLLAQVVKSPEAVALYLAACRSGAVYLPVNPAYTDDEVGFFVDDARPAVAVVDPSRATSSSWDGSGPGGSAGPAVLTLGASGEGTLLEGADQVRDPFPPVPRAAGDVVAMLYTSGTTGRPKGAMLTAENLTSNALALHAIWAWEPGDVLLHVLPIFHVHGLFVALHCAMLNGSEVIFCPSFDPSAARRELGAATVMMGVPTHYSRLLDTPGFGAEDCRSVRLFTSGSAPMTAQLHRRFAEATGHVILERYGMTEAGMITSNPYRGERVAGTVGFPLPDVEIRIAGGPGSDAGSPGEVEVRGPNVFAGYRGLPDATAAAFTADGWFRTGDIGSIDGSGRLTLAGRAGDMIISGGMNVYPKEIEQQLDQVDGVVESAVAGVAHPDLGEAVVAFVVTDRDVPDADLAAALARVARYKHPKHYLFVDELPRNAMGKVQKARLRERFRGLFTVEG